MSYSKERREWSDRFISQIRGIVGPMLLEPTSFEIDTEQAADLIIFHARDMRIAARIRQHKYSLDYPYQFTIRSVSNGRKTELQKITDGWGDWMFYGFSSKDESRIERWFVIDLSAWRAHMIRDKGRISKGSKQNGDGTHFAWFDLRTFPSNPPILIASSHEVSRTAAA